MKIIWPNLYTDRTVDVTVGGGIDFFEKFDRKTSNEYVDRERFFGNHPLSDFQALMIVGINTRPEPVEKNGPLGEPVAGWSGPRPQSRRPEHQNRRDGGGREHGHRRHRVTRSGSRRPTAHSGPRPDTQTRLRHPRTRRRQRIRQRRSPRVCLRRGIMPQLAARSNRPEAHLATYPDAYRTRNRIERFFAKLKQFLRIATRYDKLKTTFLGLLNLACSMIRFRQLIRHIR